MEWPYRYRAPGISLLYRSTANGCRRQRTNDRLYTATWSPNERCTLGLLCRRPPSTCRRVVTCSTRLHGPHTSHADLYPQMFRDSNHRRKMRKRNPFTLTWLRLNISRTGLYDCRRSQQWTVLQSVLNLELLTGCRTNNTPSNAGQFVLSIGSIVRLCHGSTSPPADICVY